MKELSIGEPVIYFKNLVFVRVLHGDATAEISHSLNDDDSYEEVLREHLFPLETYSVETVEDSRVCIEALKKLQHISDRRINELEQNIEEIRVFLNI